MPSSSSKANRNKPNRSSQQKQKDNDKDKDKESYRTVHVPKPRLFSTAQLNKKMKQKPTDGQIEKKKRSVHPNIKLREKAKFYQRNTILPTSLSTLRKALNDRFQIMKEANMFKVDKVVYTNNRTAVGKSPKTIYQREKENIVDKLMITKGALHMINYLHEFYLGNVLSFAKEIGEAPKRGITITDEVSGTSEIRRPNVIITSAMLELAYKQLGRSMGPKWNMVLEPIPKLDNNDQRQ